MLFHFYFISFLTFMKQTKCHALLNLETIIWSFRYSLRYRRTQHIYEIKLVERYIEYVLILAQSNKKLPKEKLNDVLALKEIIKRHLCCVVYEERVKESVFAASYKVKILGSGECSKEPFSIIQFERIDYLCALILRSNFSNDYTEIESYFKEITIQIESNLYNFNHEYYFSLEKELINVWLRSLETIQATILGQNLA